MAGLKLPRGVVRGCKTYLDSAAADRKLITYAYQPGRDATEVMTAEALVSRQLMGWSRDHPSLVKGAGRIAANLDQNDRRNIYYWYYATQLLHNMKNKDWERWNPKVRDKLVKIQVQGESCRRGSWDPFWPEADQWGQAGGRLFVTSLSILTLEVYYRYLPLYRDEATETNHGDALPEESPAATATGDSASAG
jgi:hypothetical protein